MTISVTAITTGHAAPDAGWRALAAAVYAQAIRDLAQAKEDTQRLDAFLWLLSEDAQTFLDALGHENGNPVRIFQNHKKIVRRIANSNMKGTRKHEPK